MSAPHLIPLDSVAVGEPVLFTHQGAWRGGARQRVASVGVKVDDVRVLSGRTYYALGGSTLVSVVA